MAFADELKKLIGKGKQAAAQNSDKIEQAVDKAADFADKKTGGKYAQQIDKVQDAAKKAIPDK
ncbi:antitoxin [Rhodococcus kroppenstedtii]|uniref:Antitoxin n=2 Tax=Rhodococcoides TaxID=3259750 RepID=A0A1I0U127_9NOCA|nr:MULTISPECIES: antitoxin [Rhodococcus]AMY20044.1 Antitoxin [Rhodococcus sp. PBTS 1]MBT1191563.1 antitoxin [Rhodococcus kroppenstedtii]MBY6314349.1 antitoxin [Rhodococcus kroppenstedtii]MBY6322045.1 antitoxin [Rhodococcus kroppenstedtii]MBY6348724.1 antitoxin [Rhodococcus corynebacterioides]